MLRPRRARRLLTALVLACLSAAATVLLAPRLADGLTYLAPQGASMRPAVEAGDLVLLRAQDSYAVGDVIGYRSTTLNVVVLHRVRAVSPNGYTTRGDNNGWLDPDHPTDNQVIGRMWLRIPHAAAVLRSATLTGLASRIGMDATGPGGATMSDAVPLVGVPGLLLFGGLVWLLMPVRQRPRAVPDRHANRRRRGPRSVPVPPGLTSSMAPALRSAAVTMALVAAAAAVVAFTVPSRQDERRQLPYRQQLSFDYTGTGAAGAAYPDGRVHWGDPVYTRLVSSLQVRAGYQLSGSVSGPVVGTLTLRPRLESSGGWHAAAGPDVTVPLSAATGSAGTTIDLPALARLADSVERASGTSLGSLTLTVDATVGASSLLAGQPFQTQQQASVQLRMDTAQLVLLDRDQPPARNGSVTTTRHVPRTLHLLGFAVPVRWFGPGAVSAGLVCLLLIALRTMAGRRAPDLGRELDQRRPDRVVRVQAPPGNACVEVASAVDLIRLADHTDAVIMHFGNPGSDGYQVDSGGTGYRYTLSLHQPPVPRPRRPGGRPTMRPWRTPSY